MPRPVTPRRRRSFVVHAPSESEIVPHVSVPLPQDDRVSAQLERICDSRVFTGAHRSQLFLRYVVGHSVAHPDEPVKEYSIALDVFDRDASYDPAVDATVRVEAGRLRSRLLEYYAGEGQSDPLLIEVPRGGYRAVIRSHHPAVIPVSRHLALLSAKPLPATNPRLRHLWAVPVAFVLGALLGYRASH